MLSHSGMAHPRHAAMHGGRFVSRRVARRGLACATQSHSRALAQLEYNGTSTMTSAPNILAVGGAHVDRRGQVAGAFRARRVQPRHDARGCRRRRLQCAAQRGAARRFGVAAVGARRRCGRRHVARAIAAAGIRDLSAVFLDRATPSYTALLDRDGEVIAGLADMALYELAFAKQIAARARCARRSPPPTPSCATPTCRPPRSSGWRRSPAASRCSPSRSRRPRWCG